MGRGSGWFARVGFSFAIVLSGILPLVLSAGSVEAAVGDQQRIVFLDRANNIWIARTDGSEQQQLTSDGGFQDVRWSPDGTRLVATGPFHEGGRGVFLLSPDPEFGLRSLGRGRSPVWSPDGLRFAYIEGGQVHIFDRGGSYQRSLDPGADELLWSPDGRKIGFTRIIDDPYETGCHIREIGWIDANSGASHTIGQSVGRFAWAGDADRLLYVSAISGTVRAYSIPDDSNALLSSTRANPCSGPVLTTPDGKTLLFLRFRDHLRDLVAINLDTGQQRIYTDLPVRFPAQTLPGAYVKPDRSGRYVYLSRSYPTDIHRLDLITGNVQAILTNDWRQVIDISPDGEFHALLNLPSGNPAQMTVRDRDGIVSAFHDVGWMAWQPSPVNQSAALGWQRTWAREDRPVAAGHVSRTWLWGPEPFDARVEHYDEAPDGIRAVRYYDKSRMEITNPFGNRDDVWYVTNGLLVTEMITGRMQVGDNRFAEREPAQQPVAGDVNDNSGPTYATLAAVLDLPAQEPGQEIRATINRDGQIGSEGPEGVTADHFVTETGHTVADVFWEYLNSDGPVWDGQSFVEGRLFDPTFFATGFPITGAYWSTVSVGGEDTEVLIQCFQRRCLTYTPDNPDGWQVEMGNVGRHYHAWRYD